MPKPLIEKIDHVANEVMDIFRDVLGYDPEDESGNIGQIIADKLPESPADFDDALYGQIHDKVRQILPDLLKN